MGARRLPATKLSEVPGECRGGADRPYEVGEEIGQRKGSDVMNAKKFVGTALMAGVLTSGALGLGAGTAQARPGPHIPGPPSIPPVLRVDDSSNWRPAPGQIKQLCPWQSPPGQWISGPHGIPCI